MTKEKGTVRGRGQEIVGRGVDALFSTPAVQRSVAAASSAQADSELEALLAAEARAATEGIEVPAPAPTTPPSPVQSAPQTARPPAALKGAIITGDGVMISDEELFGRIDVPLSDDAFANNDPFAMPDIDIPPANPARVTPTPAPTPLPTPAPQPPATPAPTRSPAPRPTFGPAFSTDSPFSPVFVDPTPAPTSGPTLAPTPAPTPTARPTQAPSPTAEPLPPSRPRVQIGGSLSDVPLTQEDLGNARPQDPFTARPEFPIDDSIQTPRRTRTEVDALMSKIDKKRIEALHAQIDQLYQDIPKRISNRPDLTAQTMGLLRQARTLLIEKPHEYVEAEYKVQQALSLYNRIENSEEWGDKYGWRVFWFEVVVFFIFVISFLGLLAFGDEFSTFLAKLVGGDSAEAGNGVFTAVGFWATFVWGGIGGVVGALYILWTHVSQRQDFERQHVMWYIAQPIMGLILGGVTFLIINTGLLSLVGGQEAAEKLRTTVQLFPALIAFIAGFRPQFVFGLLTKIIKVISPNAEES